MKSSTSTTCTSGRSAASGSRCRPTWSWTTSSAGRRCWPGSMRCCSSASGSIIRRCRPNPAPGRTASTPTTNATADAMKLLAVGDMHLGRIPVSLPDALTGHARQLGPEVAWSRSVDAAIAHGVEAVLLAGDVVDRERDFFAGYDPLRAGIERLLADGIRVLAVAGNHDTHVLPRLADHVDGLELVGRGGRWESVALSIGSVVGWSFPSRRVTRSPLNDWSEPDGPRPRIGLLHCDRDQSDSVHAPVSSAELERAGLDAWLLGHIHKPDLADPAGDNAARPSGYLGSISALRASETGVRGPWLLDVDDRQVRVQQIGRAS